ncbi:MAG: adenylosuccinate synthetase [Oscillospiraceae bacterium]
MQYEIHGQKTDEFLFTAVVDEAKPVFTTMPGWGCDISGVRKWEDLPVEARELCRIY